VHYLEEYLPEYIIVNIPVENIEILNEYVKKNPAATVFISNFIHLQKTKNPKFIHINELKNINDVKNVADIISKIGIENKNLVSFNNYKLINQQIISVFSLKGGTGKTTVSFNLAYYMKRIFDARVILIDLNFCEGVSDLSSYLRLNQIPNLNYYIENPDDGEESLKKSLIIKNTDDIDILFPPLHLTQHKKLSILLLNNLFDLLRKFYNFIIIDLPYNFDELTLESIKISNSLIMVSLPIYSCALKLSKFKTSISSSGSLNKLSILNNPYNFTSISKSNFENISQNPVLMEIPYIDSESREFIKFDNVQTDLVDMNREIRKIIDKYLII